MSGGGWFEICAHFETIERICSTANPTLEDLLTELIRPIVKSAERQDPWTRVIRLMVREALNQRVDTDMVLGEKKFFVDRLARAFMQILPEIDERTRERRFSRWNRSFCSLSCFWSITVFFSLR